MKFISSVCSDIGITKTVNQDAAMIRQAVTGKGTVLFAVVCDGMGGLEQGEVASAAVISGMSDWFEKIFPDILYHNFTAGAVKESWRDEIFQLNNGIRAYGDEKGIRLGTTFVSLLLVGNTYYICNVGDSRVYCLKDRIKQMTHDQTFVQREMDLGRMTRKEALGSSRRHMLLQCIGAGTAVEPDFYIGTYQEDSSFILCSDGLCHVVTEEEIWNMLRPDRLSGQRDMDRKIKQLVETVKDRKETDNITVTLIHALREDIC